MLFVMADIKLPNKPRKDGYYYLYIKEGSKRRRIKARTREKLKEKAEALMTGIDTTITFKQAYQLREKDAVKGIKDQSLQFRALSTSNRHDCTYARYIAGTDFENLKMASITKADIIELCVYNLDRYEMRGSSLRDLRMILNHVFKYCYQREKINTNPADRIDWTDKMLLNRCVQSAPISQRIYSEDEVSLIYSEALKKAGDTKTATPFALLYQILTGCRRGEVCCVKWSDIGEDHGIKYITIQRELVRIPRSGKIPEHQEIVDHTKTDKARRIPIWSELSELLESIKAWDSEHFPDNPYIFPAANGCIGIYSVYRMYARICKKNGIKIDKEVMRGTHALRRNVAQRLGNRQIASDILGHSQEVDKQYYYGGYDLTSALNCLEENGMKQGAQKGAQN